MVQGKYHKGHEELRAVEAVSESNIAAGSERSIGIRLITWFSDRRTHAFGLLSWGNLISSDYRQFDFKLK